jgi:hypothetical protein
LTHPKNGATIRKKLPEEDVKMNTVTLSFNKYLEMLNGGALDASASYEIEENAQITNAHKLTLKDLTFCGSVNIESDSSDIILQNCKIKGDIICYATDVVIKKCTTHAITLSGSQNVLVAQNTSDAITLSGTQNCSAVLNNTGFISVSCAKNTYVIENTVSGDINLTNTAYLLCDGNKVGGKTEREYLQYASFIKRLFFGNREGAHADE